MVPMHICTVAFDMRSKASRHASAGGYLSIRSPRTEVAARIVKSTSSIVYANVSVLIYIELKKAYQATSNNF